MKRGHVRRVEAALDAYGIVAGCPEEARETQLVDLLADVLHFYNGDPCSLIDAESADQSPEEWLAGVLDTALMHYRAERDGDEIASDEEEGDET